MPMKSHVRIFHPAVTIFQAISVIVQVLFAVLVLHWSLAVATHNHAFFYYMCAIAVIVLAYKLNKI